MHGLRQIEERLHFSKCCKFQGVVFITGLLRNFQSASLGAFCNCWFKPLIYLQKLCTNKMKTFNFSQNRVILNKFFKSSKPF